MKSEHKLRNKSMNYKPGKSPVWGNRVDRPKYLDFSRLSDFCRTLLWLLKNMTYSIPAFKLTSRIHKMYKKNGPTFLVMYLKEAHRLTMKAVAGTPERCETFPRVATRRGYPLIIPGVLRLEIEKKTVLVIKIVLTLLSIYRVIKISPVLKIDSITSPFTGSSRELPLYEVRFALERLGVFRNFKLVPDADLITSVKAGPNTRVATLGMTLDALAFKESPAILSAFGVVSEFLGNKVLNLLQQEIEFLPSWESKSPGARKYIGSTILGTLSEKVEAAGKVRIFAITDIWTQSVLRPLHDALFSSLRKITSDGTYDQLFPLYKLMEEGRSQFYSYDLSAATDRLPIDLQRQILGLLVDPRFAQGWSDLLVGRPWFLHGVPYYYAVGQPMGALSSWAMLALTHHVIVQIAAMRVGWHRVFRAYAVLGDDIVIADEDVAKSYLRLCEVLGVEINLGKSLESKDGVAEFAKRLISMSTDVSPLPPKLLIALLKGYDYLPEVLRDMLSRGLSIETFFEGRKKIPSSILWNCIGPLGFIPSAGLSPFLGDRSLTPGELRDVVQAVLRIVNRTIVEWFYQQQQESQVLIDKIGTLVWDGYMTTVVKGREQLTRRSVSEDTPAFHYLMNYLCEKAFTGNQKTPALVEWPDAQEYTFTTVYRFMSDTAEYLDSLEPVVPDLLCKFVRKTPFTSSKMKFYRSLNDELGRLGID